MTIHSNAPPLVSPESLRFACTHCGGELEVPAALAGVTGPCPLCGGETTAPQRQNVVAPSTGAARLLAKPPPRREIPPPLAPVLEHQPGGNTVLRPLHAFAPDEEPAVLSLHSVANGAANAVFPAPPAPVTAREETPSTAKEVNESVPEESPGEPAARGHEIPAERGIFGGSADLREHVLDIRPSIPMRSRHGWRRWVDTGIVSLFTGLLLATVAALRYTVPLEDKPARGLPPNLTQLVERETMNQALRGQEAGELACAAVNRYLGAGSEQAAASHLLPPPEGMALPAFPPFPSPPSVWTVSGTRRIPLTDRYLAVIQPKDAPGPVFVVEQTDNGPRLHAGPITQQSANLFEKFTATPGQGEATLYVEMRPTVPGHERDYRSGRPDLDSYRFVDVRSAFQTESKPFIACFKPESEPAKQFSRRGAHDLNWRRALVRVRWQIHREAGPWVELEKFLSSPWSGDPPLTTSSTTASASP